VIISQTPYRVSLAGGGTDLPAFYREEAGAVLSIAISRHMYVTVHERFEPTWRIAYSRAEVAASRDEIAHELVRESLRTTGIEQPLEVTTIGDVPAGTGMGSSSSLTVGLLNAFYAYQGQIASARRLGEEACRIEIEILGKPIGKQDQFAAAFGGVNYFRFNPDETVDVEPVPCRREALDELERWALVLYTDRQRSADGILKKQSDGCGEKRQVLCRMRDLAGEMRSALGGNGDIRDLGRLLHEGWELKRSLGFGIADEGVDRWYRDGRVAGAIGGKLLGAGGGGFMLFLAPPERHAAIREALGDPRQLPFQVDRRGSRIIFADQ